MTEKKYDFYPFNHSNCVWQQGNKAIIQHDRYSHYCGYVVFDRKDVPETWFNDDYDLDSMDLLAIHGGLTYKEVKGDYVVFGFDCMHAGDEDNPLLQDLDYVIKLVDQMESQLKLHIKNLSKYKKLKTKEQQAAYLDNIKSKASLKVGFNLIGTLCFACKTAQEDL